MIEDKRFAITLHYRNAPATIVRQLKDAFEQFVRDHALKLALREGNMAAEAVPKSTSKAHAVRTLWECAGKDCEPIYFGDDLTDEDAFREIILRLFSKLLQATGVFRISGVEG